MAVVALRPRALGATRATRRLYGPSLLAAGLAAALAWHGWDVVADYGPARAIHTGELRYAGPVVLGFVAVVLLAERIWPAQRREPLARGHLVDFGYLVIYAALVIVLMTLLGAGFADLVERHARWLVLPALPAVPHCLASNGATPVTLLTAYACLGALPHANLPWTYGRLGRMLISPAYHRAHHRASGSLDVNLGVVFPFWDALAGRAMFPVSSPVAPATGLEYRPVPVEQDRPVAALPRLLASQLAEPFLRAPAIRSGSS